MKKVQIRCGSRDDSAPTTSATTVAEAQAWAKHNPCTVKFDHRFTAVDIFNTMHDLSFPAII
jgi:hypothetical protein